MNDLIILGRKIGTFDGWDQNSEVSVSFYKFEPVTDISLRPADLIYLNYESGIFETYNDGEGDTTLVESGDIISLVRDLPKAGT